MKKFRAWVFMMWRPILAFLTIAVIVGCVLGFNIGSLTPGASLSEQQYVSSLTSGKLLLKDPTYIVHKIPMYALFKLNIHSLALYRAVSAAFATLAVVSCFFILREWYTDRVALLGSWLFLSSAWVLHVGRLATPEASFLLMMPLLWTAVWLYNTTLRKSALLLLSLFSALAFYIPGFGWLLVVAGIWKYKHLLKETKQVPWWFITICVLIILATLAPLAWASAKDSGVLLSAFGLPHQLPQLRTILNNLIDIPVSLVLLGPSDAVKWLGRLPILDAFSTAMLILGIYSIRYHFRLTRIQLLTGSTIILIALISLGGAVTITSLIPVVYILIAAGVAFMLQQWLTVFPRNPVARTVATSLMSVAILFVSFYHINHYFIAWPQTPATKAAFNKSLLK